MTDTIRTLTENLGTSYSISASAGCGKTYALVARVIALLRKGIPINRMLLLTFSDNAALEMKQRIIEELKSHRDERWAKTALEEVHYSSISTFHAFALEICRAYPEQIGVNHQVSLLDEFTRQKSQNKFFNNYFNDLGSQNEYQDFLTNSYIFGIDRNKFLDFFIKIYDNLEFELEHNLNVDLQAYSTLLNKQIENIKAYARAIIKDYGDLDQSKLNKTESERYPLFKELATAISHCETQQSVFSIIRNKERYIKTRKFDLKKKKYNIDISIEKLGETFEDALLAVADNTLRIASKLLTNAAFAFRDECKAKGVLSFSDVILGAKKILQNETCNFEIWQKFDCIIVDEFQDTDPHQFEIVQALSSNSSEGEIGRLVVVGDHKQSIYGFRGVEVSKYKEFITNQNLVNLSLETSRRTTQSIIKNVNEIMKQLINDYDEMNFVREDFTKNDIPHFTTIGKGENLSNAELREIQGNDIADQIRKYVGLDIFDKHTNNFRPSNFGDITILIRDRSGLSELVEALSLKNIPFSVDSPSLIYDNSFTKMFLTCLKAISEPLNAISVIGALRSSLFQCSNNDLLDFISFVKANAPQDRYIENYWSAYECRSFDFTNASPEVLKVKECLEKLSSLNVESKQSDLVSFIIKLLLTDGIALSASIALNKNEIEEISKVIVSKAISFTNLSSTKLLLDFIEQLEDERELSRSNDKILLQADANSVHIMTAHSSKGLEFPIVFYVPSMKKTQLSKRSEIFFIPNNNSQAWSDSIALLHTNKFKDSRIDDVLEQQFENEADEESRISYVALTRARDYLVVTKHHKVNSKLIAVPSSASKIAKAIEDAGIAEIETQLKEPTPSTFDLDANRETTSFKTDQELYSRNLKLKTEALAGNIERARTQSPGNKKELEEHLVTPLSTKPKNTILGPAVGKAVHRALNLIDFDGTDKHISDVCKNCAYTEGITNKSTDVENYVRRALKTETISKLNNNFYREVPISGKIGSSFYSGYIDLLIENEDHFLIVDYKTDTIDKREGISEKVEKYSTQLATYSILLKNNVKAKKIRAKFLFLNSQEEIEYEIDELGHIEKTVLEAHL